MADKVMGIEGMTCAHCEETVTEALTAAGALGLEMGQLFMRLGARVTFLNVAPRITPPRGAGGVGNDAGDPGTTWRRATRSPARTSRSISGQCPA